MDAQALRRVKAFLIDLDGTLYLGDRLFEWTPAFLKALSRRGLRRFFMTNNSSRDAIGYAEKLRRLGVDAAPEEVITSGQSAALYLREHGEIRRVYVLGTEALAEEVRRAGKEVVAERADAVLVGYATNLTFASLARAAVEIEHGAAFLATHPDLVCPDPMGMLPDCGSLCQCLTAATGRGPQEVFGKPSRWMVRLVTDRCGLRPSEIAIVGDRLYTDMRMAAENGALAILVLSGETSRQRLAEGKVRPDLVFEHVGELAAALNGL